VQRRTEIRQGQARCRSSIGHRAGASDPTLRSALEHGPADVVPQPLVIKDEIADRRRELVALPLAFRSRGSPGLPFRHGSTCGSDPVGGGTKLVRGGVRDGPGLASRVRGMPCWPTQISGRTHRMATKRASLHHLDLATHPCASRLDSPHAAVRLQGEPIRRGRGRARRKMPPKERGDGDPNR
jgi:hypothetical protein